MAGFRIKRRIARRDPGSRARLAAFVACAAMLGWADVARGQSAARSLGEPLPQGSPIPRILPQAPPAVGSGLPVTPPPGAGLGSQADQTVAVRAVSVEGATAYTAPRLAALTRGLPGPATKLAQIEAARQAILALYRGDGFVLTAVSAALGNDGLLRFIVTEGRIASVKLDGDIGPAGTQVLAFLMHLTEVRPIDTATLERYLLLAQDVPGVSLRAVLRPSTDEPGALTLVAQVQRAPFGGLFTLDNRAFNETGPQESLLVLDANSFTQFGERTELSLYETAGSTQIFGQASEEVYVGSRGLKVRLYGGSGTANPWGQLGAIGYQGTTNIGGVSVSYPLLRSRQQVLTIAGLFDVLDEQIDTATGADNAEVPASKESLRVLRASADYALQDLLLGGDRTGVNAASLRLSQGLPILGAVAYGTALAARVGERPDFFKASAEVSRTQTLFEPWNGASIALYGLLSGQLSPDVLPPSEKFFLGGLRLNRGFYSGEVTGDNAISTSVELQLNTSTSFDAFGTTIAVAPQFYGFYDWGETWENQRTDPNRRLASAGGGVRISVTRYAEVDFEGVARLTRQPQNAAATVSALPASAFYWRVLGRF